MQFPNGFCVSVQFGWMNYCDNRSFDVIDRPKKDVSCANAEVAVWNNKDEWVRGWPHACAYDDVQGHLTPDQVLDILNWAKAQEVVK